jgi:hypothetical protein
MQFPVALYPASRGGRHARLAGTLSLEDRCLYLIDPAGKRWLPLFRAPGTVWDGAARTLTLGSRSFRPGDSIQLSGQPLGRVEDTSQWVHRPSGCDISAVWLVTMDLT